MTHIDEGRLQAYLDDELHLDERWRAERHLEGCELCRRELRAAAVRAEMFADAVRLLEAAPRRREDAVGWPRSRAAAARRMLPRAAVFLLFVGAAASATVPGSPVRRWIGELVPAERVSEPAGQLPAEVVTPAAAPEVAPPESGVFVEAVDGAVEVVLRDAREVRVRSILVGGTRAGVTAIGDATAGQFTTGAGRVEVRNARGGEIRVEVPRGATTATVIINEEVVLRKQDGNVDLSTDLPQLDSAGIAFSVEH